MDKVCLIAVLAILAGCAANQPAPTAAVDAGTLQATALAEPSAVLEISDFTSSTVCEEVTVTGSRLIRGEACTTTDVNPHAAVLEEQRRQWQIDDINRRSAAELERQRREALRAQFPQGRF